MFRPFVSRVLLSGMVTFSAVSAQTSLPPPSETLQRLLNPAGSGSAPGEIQDCPVPAGAGRTRGRRNERGLQGLPPDAIITNGVIKLGINPTGQLIVPGTVSIGGERRVGLRYIFPDGSGESETASYGCPCEGWGVIADGDKGWANENRGVVVDVASVSFTTTADSAVSSVLTPGGKLRVSHDFHTVAATPNVYEITVTLENVSGGTINDIRYRRALDFDVHPTPTDECITIQPSSSDMSHFADATTDGFAVMDLSVPLRTDIPRFVGAPVTDHGPYDQGAAFDFVFDPLNAGESVSFNLYYGAASNQAHAEEVAGSVLTEVYAFGKPQSASGICTDSPNVFIMGFSGVGGDPLFQPPSQEPSSAPSSAPTVGPSSAPSSPPSTTPSSSPSAAPSVSPSSVPSSAPSSNPTSMPSSFPSNEPSHTPSAIPSSEPSFMPSSTPSSKPSLRPSAAPSDTPSSVPSSNPSNMPSSQPSNGVCVERGYDYACGFTTLDQRSEGYTAICAVGKKRKNGSIQYYNQCKKNRDLEGLAPGDSLGESGQWVLQDCGCCDESLIPDGAKLKKADAPYCKTPICTPENDAWEPCDDLSPSSKSSKKGGGTKVKKIRACIHNNEGFEERCVDPFYTPESMNEFVECGRCVF